MWDKVFDHAMEIGLLLITVTLCAVLVISALKG